MQFACASTTTAFFHLVRKMATKFVDARVRVNSIAAGVFPSEMRAGESNEHRKRDLSSEANNPPERCGYDSDMGAFILFVAGSGDVFLNAQVVYPNRGGYLGAP